MKKVKLFSNIFNTGSKRTPIYACPKCGSKYNNERREMMRCLGGGKNSDYYLQVKVKGLICKSCGEPICDPVLENELGKIVRQLNNINKHRKAGTLNPNNKIILLEKTGSGKSYKALEMAIANKGTVVVSNGCTGVSSYIKKFPSLEKFTREDSDRPFKCVENNKYFIEGKPYVRENYSAEILCILIIGSDYGYIGDDKNALAIFDDCSWEAHRSKVEDFWKLSHADCQIVISLQDLDDLLGFKLDNDMKKDILQYWTIVGIEGE